MALAARVGAPQHPPGALRASFRARQPFPIITRSGMPAKLQLYYITDRTQTKSRSLDDCLAGAIAAGVDYVQIREKDLPARTLLTLTEATVAHAERQGQDTRVIVNDRLDVALAARAHGVHLGARSMPIGIMR